jgi:Family of unknown function (DUF5990)
MSQRPHHMSRLPGRPDLDQLRPQAPCGADRAGVYRQHLHRCLSRCLRRPVQAGCPLLVGPMLPEGPARRDGACQGGRAHHMVGHRERVERAQAPADRNLGLAWGEVPGDGTLRVFRGARLRLADVDPGVIEPAMRPGHRLVARVRLTDARGNPTCARVRRRTSPGPPSRRRDP